MSEKEDFEECSEEELNEICVATDFNSKEEIFLPKNIDDKKEEPPENCDFLSDEQECYDCKEELNAKNSIVNIINNKINKSARDPLCTDCTAENESCFKCRNLMNNVNDGQEKKATKFLLKIKATETGKKGVFASNTIPKGIRFGPVFVETRRGYSNWLMHVNCPRGDPKFNLTGFSCGNDVYYRSNREIQKGEELLVHFDDKFTMSLGLDPDKFYPLICTPCDLGFKSDIYFVKHKMKCTYGPKEGVAQCPYCDVLVLETKYLEGHMKYCPKRYEKELRTDILPENVRGSFIIQKNFKCDSCSYKASSLFKLKMHSQIHGGNRYKCELCEKRFRSSFTLKTHFYSHTGEKPFECQYCDYKSTRKSTLDKHIQGKHVNDKKYGCPVCNSKFIGRSQLMKHYKTHTGERLYPCEVCKKRFTRPENLKTHMNIHNGLKFKCIDCEYESHYKAILKEHMKKKHEFENSFIEENITKLVANIQAEQAANT